MSSFKEIISSEKPVLIDFYADWCGPCKMLAPAIKEVKNEMGDKARIIKIDVDKNPQVANNLGVRGVPTLMIYQNGELKWRQSGVVPAYTIAQKLKEFIS